MTEVQLLPGRQEGVSKGKAPVAAGASGRYTERIKYHLMKSSIAQKPKNVKTPVLLSVILYLLALLFPGQQITVQPRLRRQEFKHVYHQALDLSLQRGYNAVNWGAL